MQKRFLLDQMFDRAVLTTLREAGFDVLAVSEIDMATADDAEIMQWAIQQQRTVITLDDHFGDWAVLPLSTHAGVIRLKVNPTTTTNTLQLLIPFLRSIRERSTENQLVIVRSNGVRWIRTTD